jgi:hypothetical protein
MGDESRSDVSLYETIDERTGRYQVAGKKRRCWIDWIGEGSKPMQADAWLTGGPSSSG